jgi:hypothetical protein
VCLANGTTERFILVRAKGNGRLRTASLLAGTERLDGEGFAYRLAEPGWRTVLEPGQALALETRFPAGTGQALFSLQDAAGRALACLTYALEPDPASGPGPVRGVLALQPQAPGAQDLLLVPGPPGNVFLVRQAQLPALRQVLEEHARERPPEPEPQAPAEGACPGVP